MIQAGRKEWAAGVSGSVASGMAETSSELGGAWSVAIDLDATLSNSFLSAAKQAYIDGFMVVSLLCALATAMAACLTFWALRQVSTEADDTQLVTSGA